jgi:hypothetical protein
MGFALIICIQVIRNLHSKKINYLYKFHIYESILFDVVRLYSE